MTSRLPAIGTIAALAAVILVGLTMPGLQFGDSAFLFGVAAALLPLVIHLIGRQRATPHRFAAISFLLRAERRVARRLDLNNLALLALRTVATALIPIILARPHAASADIDRPPPAQDASTVVVIDASFSMQMRVGGTTFFDLARDRVSDLIREMGDSEEMGLVVAGRRVERVTPGLTADRALLRAAAGGLAVSSERGDVAAGLADAEMLLQSSTRASRRIVLVSDFAGPDFPAWRPSDVAIALYRTDVSRGARLRNRSVTGVRVRAAAEVAADTFHFAVTVANHSDEPARAIVVQLQVGSKEVSGALDIAPQSEATKAFHIALPPGETFTGRAAIDPDDLPLDNSFTFVVSSKLGARVLVVNGAPSTIPHRDEVHYLTRALRVASTPRGALRTTVVTADEPVDFGAFDVVFLCNIASGSQILTETRARSLEAAVARGVGLVVTLGANSSAQVFTGTLDRLLPATVHTQNVRSPTTPLATSPPISSHGAVQAFKEAAAVGAPQPAFTRTVILLPKSGVAAETLLRFSDGTPALVERVFEAGRVLLFASTIDRDWTDLPIRPLFAPWIADIVEAVTPKSGVDRTTTVHPGDPLPLPAGAEAVVTDPAGVIETRTESDSRVVIARRVGLHRIDVKSSRVGRPDAVSTSTISVTHDPAESNVARNVGMPAFPRAAISDASSNARPLGPPLMTAFAIALLALLFVEAVVVARR